MDLIVKAKVIYLA